MIKKCDVSTHVTVTYLNLAVWGLYPSVFNHLFRINRIYLYVLIGSFFYNKKYYR